MATITEDYVSFETAKLLKEKGFDEPFFFFYRTDDEIKNIHHACNANAISYHQKYIDDEVVNAPTLQMAMKWLRKKYNIHIEPRYFPMPNIYRYVIIRSLATIENIDSHPQYFNSYEEACDTAIKYCLENLL